MQPWGIDKEDLSVCLDSELLGACSPALLLEILTSSKADFLNFPAGAVIYSPHHFRRCLGVVLDGELLVTKGELSVSILSPGEVFGAAALYSDAPEFATTITARRDSRCLLLSQKLVDQLISRDTGFRERYLRYLTGRIHFLSSRLDSLSRHGAESKLGRYLLVNADQNHTLTCSATELAKRLGLGRASLYRAFEVLEDSGLITRQGKTITIPDPASLAKLCE